MLVWNFKAAVRFAYCALISLKNRSMLYFLCGLIFFKAAGSHSSPAL
jgi:hypothetical protein